MVRNSVLHSGINIARIVMKIQPGKSRHYEKLHQKFSLNARLKCSKVNTHYGKSTECTLDRISKPFYKFLHILFVLEQSIFLVKIPSYKKCGPGQLDCLAAGFLSHWYFIFLSNFVKTPIPFIGDCSR